MSNLDSCAVVEFFKETIFFSQVTLQTSSENIFIQQPQCGFPRELLTLLTNPLDSRSDFVIALASSLADGPTFRYDKEESVTCTI